MTIRFPDELCICPARRRWVHGALAAGLGTLCRPVWPQQDYPSRSIRLIVPFAPGGAADVSARIIAEQFGRRLGQPVVVENRPGAGGNIGTQAVASAKPDGYTLLLGFDGTMVINPHVYDKVPFDTLKDFAPIGKIGDIGLLMVANPKAGVKTLSDVIESSKAQPSGLSVGSGGSGTTAHVLLELIKQRTGANLTHIPYKGAAPATAGVIGGETQLAIVGVVGIPQHISAGTLQGVAFSSAQRARILPDVPTIAESGLPGLVVNSWNGLLIPAQAPRPIIERLAAELNLALADPEIRERLDKLGYATAPTSPEGFGEQLRNDLLRYGQVVKAASIKAG